MNRHQIDLAKSTSVVFLLVLVAIWTSEFWPKIRWTAELAAIFLVGRCWWNWRSETLTEGRNLWTDIGLCVPMCTEKASNGIRRFGIGLVWFSGWLVLALALIVAAGAIITPGFWHDPEFFKKASGVSLAYFGGVIGQQLVMHGYFTNRMGKILPERPKLAALLVGLVFAIVHLPNWLLAGATFIFATTSAWLFLTRCRNLYLMIFAQLILSHAFKLLIAVPLIGHGCMRVGPFYLMR